MTLSSLLTSISLIYIKFAKFWYTVNPLKICPLLRGVRYSELIWQRLSHLGLNILFAIQDMSAIWDVRYWKVSLYNMFIYKNVQYLTSVSWTNVKIQNAIKIWNRCVHFIWKRCYFLAFLLIPFSQMHTTS